MTLRPFNILYLSSFGTLGSGGQESLFHLVTNLDRTQFCPYVNLPTVGGLAKKLRAHDIELNVLDLPKVMNFKIYRNLRALYKLKKLCSDWQIDLIHTDGPRNTFYAGIIASIKRIPLIWHVRASNQDRFDPLLYHLSSKIILVANSLRMRFNCVDRRHKFVRIYNGIDLSKFQAGISPMAVRQQYKISNKSIVIAVIGRIEPLKGLKYLIEACGRLKNRLEEFYILVVGDVVDVSYLEECKLRAAEFGIQDRLIFTGYQDGVSQILNESDMFVLPSLFEAFPRSVIEAMGAGKPVIVTDVGGCSEAVEDKASGFLVPPANSMILADRILALGMYPEERKRMGKAARIRAEKMFTIQQNVKQTERLYLEVLGKGVKGCQ